MNILRPLNNHFGADNSIFSILEENKFIASIWKDEFMWSELLSESSQKYMNKD